MNYTDNHPLFVDRNKMHILAESLKNAFFRQSKLMDFVINPKNNTSHEYN